MNAREGKEIRERRRGLIVSFGWLDRSTSGWTGGGDFSVGCLVLVSTNDEDVLLNITLWPFLFYFTQHITAHPMSYIKSPQKEPA